jgi:hypothetical protein
LNPLIGNSGLTGAESGAINGITNMAAGGNPYASQIGANASSLLAGGGAQNQAGAVNQNYQNYQAQTQPLASNTNYDPNQNPGTAALLAQIQGDVGNSVNSQFAGAGRDMSGANQMAYGRGIAQGEAPVLFNQYNANRTAQQGAAGNLYNAGNTNAGILSGMQQQANANTQVGTQAATDAWNAQLLPYQTQLQAQQMGQQIPAQNLGMLAQIGIPLAGLGRTSSGSGTSNTTNNPSLLTQIGQGVGIAGSLFGAPAGGTSAAAGMGQAASGGLGALAGLFGL